MFLLILEFFFTITNKLDLDVIVTVFYNKTCLPIERFLKPGQSFNVAFQSDCGNITVTAVTADYRCDPYGPGSQEDLEVNYDNFNITTLPCVVEPSAL